MKNSSRHHQIQILLCTSLLAVSLHANAIVNIEDMRPATSGKPWTTDLEFSADGTSGNSDTQKFSAGLTIRYQAKAYRAFLLSEYSYGESNNEKNIDKGFVHGRYQRPLSDKLTLEAFAQSQTNEFTSLVVRNLLGAGLRMGISDQPGSSVYLGAGAFYEDEELESASGDNTNESDLRLNFYLAVRHKFSESLRLVSTTYYQPNTDDFDDYRAMEDFSLINKATDNIDFKISINIAYDNLPPENIDQADVTYHTGIVWALN